MTDKETIEKAKEEVANEYGPFPPSFKETLNQVTLRALQLQREEIKKELREKIEEEIKLDGYRSVNKYKFGLDKVLQLLKTL